MDTYTLIGSVIIFLFAFARFSTRPPDRNLLSTVTPLTTGSLHDLFSRKPTQNLEIPPPARSNTTICKFSLFRIAYGLIGIGVFLLLYKIPGLLMDLQKTVDMVEGIVGADVDIDIQKLGPLGLAIFVAVVLPVLPIFNWGDTRIRAALYLVASCPGYRKFMETRLKNAPYEPGMVRHQNKTVNVLDFARGKLKAERFVPADINYNQEEPTTKSLWTKAALLIAQIEDLKASGKYNRAFDVITNYEVKEENESTIARDAYEYVQSEYRNVMKDARECFAAISKHPDDEETRSLEDNFREDCKRLLNSIYRLLSRILLYSHIGDRERIRAMSDIGIRLEPLREGPVPTGNEAIWLLIIVSALVIFPLTWFADLSLGDAVRIASIYFFATILSPVMIAAHYPRFSEKRGYNLPAIGFPIVSGMLAALLGVAIHILGRGVLVTGASLEINLKFGWSDYLTNAYPWSILVFVMTFLIAILMRTGTYPDPSKLKGLTRYQSFGTLSDGAILAGFTVVLMYVVIKPILMKLNPARFEPLEWQLLILPAVIALVIGFLVPTWYRARVQSLRKQREGTKTIGLLGISNPSHYLVQSMTEGGGVSLLGDILASAGLGRLKAGQESRAKRFDELVKAKGFDFSRHMEGELREKLILSGFKIIPVNVKRSKPKRLVVDYTRLPDKDVDAFLDVAPRRVGYAAAGGLGKPEFGPEVAIDVQLVSAGTNEVLYSDTIGYGTTNPLETGTRIEAPKEHHYKGFDALIEKTEEAIKGLELGIERVSERITGRVSQRTAAVADSDHKKTNDMQ